MPSARPMEPLVAADRLGPYRLLRPISAGGMARVYEGRLESLAGVSTRVAIKVIHPDLANEAGFTDLFIQEARISARLEHLNLVRVQQFNREGGHYYLVMEFIEGITFRKVISAVHAGSAALDVATLADMGRQVCDGLAYAHALVGDHGEPLHLVHRDMKPSNMMLNSQGVAKLLDFGISYARGTDESAGAVKGTWGYMAPEQAAGEPVGPGADVFGLAAVLYELAAREPLFPEQDNATIRRLLASDEAARRAASLGGDWTPVRSVLVRALQRDPAARYRSAAAMGRALGDLVPNPTEARDQLVALVAKIRSGDASRPSPQADASASVSTMSAGPAGVAPLPVAAGSLHAPRRAAGRAPARARRSGMSGALFSLGFAAVSVAVLLFTVWRLFLWPRSTPAPRPPPSVTASDAASGQQPSETAPGESSSAVAPGGASGPPAGSAVAGGAAPAPGTAPASSPGARLPVEADAPAVPRGPSSSDRARRAIVDELRPATPPRSASTPPTSTPVTTTPPSPAPAAAAPASPAAAPAPVAGEGALSLGSTPRAQVTIDGAYVRYTPLLEYAVPSGSHVVLLVTEDGRRKTFRVDVPAGQVVQRVWNFDASSWEDGGP